MHLLSLLHHHMPEQPHIARSIWQPSAHFWIADVRRLLRQIDRTRHPAVAWHRVGRMLGQREEAAGLLLPIPLLTRTQLMSPVLAPSKVDCSTRGVLCQL